MGRFNPKYVCVFKIVLLITMALFIIGCSSRDSSPVRLEDSTIIYPSKSKDGIYATITFSKKVSKKTGKPLNVNSVFKLKNKARLYATIDLKNYDRRGTYHKKTKSNYWKWFQNIQTFFQNVLD